MSRRTAEGDILQEMGSTLNDTISKQSSPDRFGSVMSSAGFVSERTVEDITSIGGISKYDKVSRIMSAVKDYITTSGRVTQKFDQFILLLYNKLRLDRLAQDLVEKLKGRKPGYQSPLLKGASGSSYVSAEFLEEKGASSVCAVQVFTETMTPDELCSWLHRCYQMPPDDCKTMKDKNIGGFAFKAITEGEKWNEFGISMVGLILLKGPIMKEICPAVPDPGQREMTTVLAGHSSARNGGGSGCGLAQGNGTHNTSAPPARSETASHSPISEEDFARVSEILMKHSPKWRQIGRGLGFKAHKLDEIQSRPVLFTTAPSSYLEAMLSEWQQWAPGDMRGSTNYATLACLKSAVDKAGFGRTAELF